MLSATATDTAHDGTPVTTFSPDAAPGFKKPAMKVRFSAKRVEAVVIDGPFTTIKLEGVAHPLRTWNPRNRYDLLRLVGRKIEYFDIAVVDRKGPHFRLKIGVEGQHWLVGGETRMALSQIQVVWDKVMTRDESDFWSRFLVEPADSDLVLEEGVYSL